MKKYMFKSLATDEFIAIFQEVAGADVRAFFETWTKQPGFPVVTLEEDLTITQRRLSQTGIIEGPTWFIPLDVTYCKDGITQTVTVNLSKAEEKFPVEGCEWIKLNSLAHGFLRTAHNGRWFGAIRAAIEANQLPILDRYTFLRDAAALCRIGLSSYTSLVQILPVFQRETELLGVTVLMNVVSQLDSDFGRDKELFGRFGRYVLSPVMTAIGTVKREGEPPSNEGVRASLFLALLRFEDPGTREFLAEEFRKYQVARQNLGQQAFATFQTGARFVTGGPAFLRQLITENIPPAVRTAAVRALGSSPLAEFTAQLDDILHNGTSEDISLFVGGSVYERENSNCLWEYANSNADFLIEKFGTVAFLLPGLFEAAIHGLFSDVEVAGIQALADKYKDAIFHRVLVQGVERIAPKKQMMANYGDEVIAAVKGLIGDE
jgi:hypothetical protein